MKKTFKKLMAFAMVAVMMANPMSALAAQLPDTITSPAQGSADASGNVEDFVDTSIFKVVLPTSAEGTFDFKMDPQGLIAATSGEAYTGATFEKNATVFFNTASGNASGDWKSQSSYIEVFNKGTVDVNVTVEATITGLDDIAMAASADFASGDAAIPELYLAFTASGDASGDAQNGANVALTENGATINAVLAAANENMYEFNYDGSKYTYDLKPEFASGDADDFDNYSFALTGACNPYADWSKVKNAAPAVKVIWTLENADSAISYLSSNKMSASSNTVTVTLPDGATTISSVAITKTDGTTKTLGKSTAWTYTNNILKISTDVITPNSGATITVTFNDTAKTTAIITLQ